jgi:hypothetical protein
MASGQCIENTWQSLMLQILIKRHGGSEANHDAAKNHNTLQEQLCGRLDFAVLHRMLPHTDRN